MARVIGACALLLAVLVAGAASAAGRAEASGAGSVGQLQGYGGGGLGRKVGARTEVRNVEGDREVQELGRYCVEEHNRLQEGCGGGRLEFDRVVSAQRQVVAGIKYYLRVVAAEEGASGNRVFDAVVVVQPWLQSRELLTFAPADAK